MVFSPKQQLKGQCALLTGGLGFQGSVVLEQLLRLTEVGRQPASADGRLVLIGDIQTCIGVHRGGYPMNCCMHTSETTLDEHVD